MEEHDLLSNLDREIKFKGILRQLVNNIGGLSDDFKCFARFIGQGISIMLYIKHGKIFTTLAAIEIITSNKISIILLIRLLYPFKSNY